MSKIIVFHGEAFRVSAVTEVTPVTSTVSGRYPFYFLVVTRDTVHPFFFQTPKEAHHERQKLLHLLGNHP